MQAGGTQPQGCLLGGRGRGPLASCAGWGRLPAGGYASGPFSRVADAPVKKGLHLPQRSSAQKPVKTEHRCRLPGSFRQEPQDGHQSPPPPPQPLPWAQSLRCYLSTHIASAIFWSKASIGQKCGILRVELKKKRFSGKNIFPFSGENCKTLSVKPSEHLCSK